MDPIQVNINISLELGDKTVSVLQQLLAAAPKPAQRKPAAKPETKPAPAPETKEAPAPGQEAPTEGPEQEQAPEAAEEAAPEAPATTEISDEELREIVYNVRKAKPGNPQQIKNVIFPEFGIKTSIECPMERRAELVARLNELAA